MGMCSGQVFRQEMAVGNACSGLDVAPTYTVFDDQEYRHEDYAHDNLKFRPPHSSIQPLQRGAP